MTGDRLDSQQLLVGANRDEPTAAVLTLQPDKRDDGRRFRCAVRNRAMPKGEVHQASAQIKVNCESPEIIFVLLSSLN